MQFKQIERGKVSRPKPPYVSLVEVLVVLRKEAGKTGAIVTQRAFLEAIKAVQNLEQVTNG